MKQWAGSVVAGVVAASAGWAQDVVSARAGMVHYAEGRVFIDDKAIKISKFQFPEVKEGQTLRTEAGRAEVLLAPGVFLRLAEDGALRMVSSKLEDTRLDLLAGSALTEVVEKEKDNSIKIRYKDATITLLKNGLYRIDADAATLKVYDGVAEVLADDRKILAKRSAKVSLGETVLAAKFDPKTGDSLHRWAARRSGYLAIANVSSANMIHSGLSNGFGSGWMWNPYFGMYTFVPYSRSLWSPFGYLYYSPRQVYQAYAPVQQGPQGGGFGSREPSFNPNLGYSTWGGRTYGGGGPVMAPSGAAAAAPAESPRAAEPAAPRGGDGGGRAQ